MADYGFGGPRGGIIQTAFVVEDVRAAVEWWVRDLRAGPFFLFDRFPGGAPAFYHGEPSRAQVAIAMGFAGHMQIELLQPLDDHPSVYRDTIARRGYGFHHFGIAVDDVAAETRAYQERGYSLSYTAEVPTGGAVAYLERPGDPGFVELIPGTPGMDEAFTGFWRASIGWDGRDPLRAVG